VVVPCRALGVLMMEDEAGGDSKVLAVPEERVLHIYDHWRSYKDINIHRLKQIQHFFEHYKDLEEGKWVKVLDWGDVEAATQEILHGLKNYK